MDSNVVLKTEGYDVSFELKRYPDDDLSLDLRVTFSLDPRIGKVKAQSMLTPIRLSDLDRLITYLEHHVVVLQKDSWSRSDPFVLTSRQFRIQAFEGDVRSKEDGEFTVQFMVNVGSDKESGTVYLGGEAVVTLENVNNFIASMRHVLTAMSYM